MSLSGKGWDGAVQETSGWAFRCDEGDAEQTTSDGAGAGLCSDRQAEREPSSEIKRCCFFPPACQSRSQQVDWNGACFCWFFILCIFASRSSTATKLLFFLSVFLKRGGCCYPDISWAGLGKNVLCIV